MRIDAQKRGQLVGRRDAVSLGVRAGEDILLDTLGDLDEQGDVASRVDVHAARLLSAS